MRSICAATYRYEKGGKDKLSKRRRVEVFSWSHPQGEKRNERQRKDGVRRGKIKRGG